LQEDVQVRSVLVRWNGFLQNRSCVNWSGTLSKRHQNINQLSVLNAWQYNCETLNIFSCGRGVGVHITGLIVVVVVSFSHDPEFMHEIKNRKCGIQHYDPVADRFSVYLT
jgi:hypothetical protein